MDVILSIIGVLITILLSEPIYKKFKSFCLDRKLRNWTADLQKNKGIIKRVENYAFLDWNHTIEVDKYGNCNHFIFNKIVNIQEFVLKEVNFPIYSDSDFVKKDLIKPWAKSFSKKILVNAILKEWSEFNSSGVITIKFNPPLVMGEEFRYIWGYFLPKTFREGNEYYNWDISTLLHYRLRGKICFDRTWKIVYAHWNEIEILKNLSQKIKVSKNRILKFEIKGLLPSGNRIQIKFGLIKLN